MKIIELDASNWATDVDFYTELLAAIGAPRWHGTSVDAFIDSMIYGGINALEPPYSIRIHNTANIPSEVKNSIDELARIIAEARSEHLSTKGQDVEVLLESLPR